MWVSLSNVGLISIFGMAYSQVEGIMCIYALSLWKSLSNLHLELDIVIFICFLLSSTLRFSLDIQSSFHLDLYLGYVKQFSSDSYTKNLQLCNCIYWFLRNVLINIDVYTICF